MRADLVASPLELILQSAQPRRVHGVVYLQPEPVGPALPKLNLGLAHMGVQVLEQATAPVDKSTLVVIGGESLGVRASVGR